MTDEARERLAEFRNKEGELIVGILDTMTDEVEKKYGKDMAMGFVLGLDTVYLALTGKEMAEALSNE